MTYRRRTFIPIVAHGQQIGHIIRQHDAMEAHTAEGELVGRYPTRREAASALWAFMTTQRNVRAWSTRFR